MLNANRQIDVGAGTGITVAADTVALDKTYTDGLYQKVTDNEVLIQNGPTGPTPVVGLDLWVDPTGVAQGGQLETRYVNAAGDSMVGPLLLDVGVLRDVTEMGETEAVPKFWVDDTFLAKAGGTVSGPVTLDGLVIANNEVDANAGIYINGWAFSEVVIDAPTAPTTPGHLTNKAYVDQSMPIGAIITYGGTVAPPGWHLCDGTAHGSAALQAITGSPNTPNLLDRFIVAAGWSYAQGSIGGVSTHAHTMADHQHEQAFPLHGDPTGAGGIVGAAPHNTPVNGISGRYISYPNYGGFGVSAIGSPAGGYPFLTGGRFNGAAGWTDAADNQPPYYALTYIIKKV